MKTANQKIKLGVFVILGTLILITALYFIGNRQHLFTNNITLKAQFNNINGLQIGNNVRYSGIDIGTVSGIQMVSDTLIDVTMAVKESQALYLKKNAIATIGSDGLVGNMIINILPRPEKSVPVTPGDTINTYSKIGTDDMLTTLNVTNENAALLTADLLKITTSIVDGKGTLGILINDDSMGKDVKEMVTNLRKASYTATASLKHIESITQSIDMENSLAGTLLTDSIQGQKLKVVIENLENSSTLLLNVGNQLSEIVGDVKDGEGALNYLSTDKEFVEDLENTMQNIKESSAAFSENMEALKSNWLFRGYYKKQARAAKKAAKENENLKD